MDGWGDELSSSEFFFFFLFLLFFVRFFFFLLKQAGFLSPARGISRKETTSLTFKLPFDVPSLFSVLLPPTPPNAQLTAATKHPISKYLEEPSPKS